MVRLGSVKQAAVELEVSESAISLHVSHLRKEFEDELFTRTASGLAFTPGGLRLARRATDMLNLQERTRLEVRQAGAGRRPLRIASSSLFAEYAAPGLIELFTRWRRRRRSIRAGCTTRPGCSARPPSRTPERCEPRCAGSTSRRKTSAYSKATPRLWKRQKEMAESPSHWPSP